MKFISVYELCIHEYFEHVASLDQQSLHNKASHVFMFS